MKKYLASLKKFHGHLGPYVVLGYRMGKWAQLKLGRIEKINIQINPQPPVACILDGLQLATGCTLGKNTIKLHKSKKFSKATFYHKDKKFSFTLTNQLKDKLKGSSKKALYFIKNSDNKMLLKVNK